MSKKIIVANMLPIIAFFINSELSIAAPPQLGYYEIQALHSGKCLDVPQSSTQNGVEIIQYKCGNTTNQRWKLTEGTKGYKGYYEIQALHSGKCLDVSQVRTQDGVKIIQSSCMNTINQRWKLTEGPRGYYEIKALHSGKCLDVPQSSTQDSIEIIQYKCGNTTNQRWKLIFKQPIIGSDLKVRFIRKLSYNLPKRYIPGAEDKPGYWYQKDYGMVKAFDFEMQNHLLAAVIEEFGGPTRLFIINWKTGDLVKRVRLSPNQHLGIENIQFSPDGKRIAVATGQDQEIMLWNARSGTLISKKKTEAPAGFVDWHPKGKILAVAAKQYVEIWEVEPLNRKNTVSGARTPNVGWTMSAQWSPDGNYLAIGTNGPAVYIHHYQSGRQSSTLVPKPKGSVDRVAWNADGNLLASASFGHGGTLKIWKDPKKAVGSPYEKKYQMIREFNPSHSPGVDWWTKMTWYPSGKILAFGDNQSNFLFQDIPSGKLLKNFIPHKGSTTLEAHWKGNYLITVGSYPDKTFRVWKVEVRKDEVRVRIPEQRTCTISGRLHGGSESWRITSVHALGLNVGAHTNLNQSVIHSARISEDGSYILHNLPSGKYQVTTDIRADTMVGFKPTEHMVICQGTVPGIDFTFSR